MRHWPCNAQSGLQKETGALGQWGTACPRQADSPRHPELHGTMYMTCRNGGQQTCLSCIGVVDRDAVLLIVLVSTKARV